MHNGNRDLRHISATTIVATCFALIGSIGLIAGDKSDTIPSPAALKKANALVRELYAKEYKQAATDTAEKARLAGIFLNEAIETRDYPAGRYVLLREARDMAQQAGDAATALQAVDHLALSFPLKASLVFQMKVAALARSVAAAPDEYAVRTVTDAAVILLEDALADDDYASALRLLRTAETAAKRLKNVPLAARILRRKSEVLKLEKEYAAIDKYVTKLKTQPLDGQANLEVGTYYTFQRGNWKKGIPLLAKSNDGALAPLAKIEFSKPKRPTEQIKLADGWRTVANTTKGVIRARILLHAWQWYRKAELQLLGPARLKITKLMQKVMADLPAEYRIGEITHEVRKFEGHSGPVFDVAFSPDARKLVSGGQDGAVIVWDARTGKMIRRLEGHAGPVWTVAFAPDGRRVLSGGFDKTIRLWDLASGKDVRQYLGHEDYVRSVVFTPDGRHILSAGDDRAIRFWDVHSGTLLYTLQRHGHYVWHIALSYDGKRAVSASLDRTVGVWDISADFQAQDDVQQKKKDRFTGHTDTVLATVISFDGRRALSAGSDKTVLLWDIESKKTLRSLSGHTGYVTTVAFSPDDRRGLSAGYDRTIRLWDLKTGKTIRTLEGHTGRIWSVAFSPDGRHAASASHDGTIRLWGGSGN